MLRGLFGVLLVLLLIPAVAGGHPADSVIDDDHDAVNNFDDNCRYAYNPDQRDLDRDEVGDPCDGDLDGDAVDNAGDNCAGAHNTDQRNLDGDSLGDACDSDDDNDRVPDERDNCRRDANAEQEDADGDGIGNVCDPDTPPAQAPGPTTPPADGGSSGAGGGAGSDGAGGGGPGPAGPRDGEAPGVTLRIGRRHGLDGLQAGLMVPVSCSEGCFLTATLLLPTRTARELGISARRLGGMAVLGQDAAAMDSAAGTFLFVDLGKRTLARLKRRRTVRPLLRVEAADPAGNRRTVRRRLTLAR